MTAAPYKASASDNSADFGTATDDVEKLETESNRDRSQPQPNAFSDWNLPKGLESWQANLLTEDFKARLKQSLEHFTRQQQALAQRAKPESRPSSAEAEEEEAPQEAPRSRAFQSPVASLATMGPAARELAQMIQASQQRQQHIEHGPYWSAEEDRIAAPPPNPWMGLPNPQYYQDYWRAQTQGPYPPPFAWDQGSQPPPAGAALAPRGANPAAWGPRNEAIPPLPTLPHPAAAELDPRSQAEFNQSLQMLQEAQRMSAIASCRIQTLYQNANSRKRKGPEDDDGKSAAGPSKPAPLQLPTGEGLAHLPVLQALFPNTESEQKCAVCGTHNTPVWRRIDKQLVCNACGLRKRRSAKRSSEAQQPQQAQQAQQLSQQINQQINQQRANVANLLPPPSSNPGNMPAANGAAGANLPPVPMLEVPGPLLASVLEKISEDQTTEQPPKSQQE